MSLATAFLLLTPLCAAQVPLPRPTPGKFQPIPARELTPTTAPIAPPAPSGEKLVSFDPRRVRLDWREGRWQLFHQDQLLKDFANQSVEARQAHTLIRDLNLTQVGTLGGDRPVMEYWLSNGHAPQGRTWGLRTVTFSNETLQVENIRNDWCVRDDKQVLLVFGKQEDQARQALSVLQKYGFNQVGLVGNNTPAMMVFFRQHQNTGGLPGTRVKPLQAVSRPVRQVPITPTHQPGKFDAATLASLPPTPVIPSLTPFMTPPEHGRIQQASYKPPQQPTAPVELTAPLLFDWQQTQVVRDNGDWKLQIGNERVGNFGLDEPAAKLAHAAAHFYRFTEYQRIGKGAPAAGYFLCSGQAPRGLMAGLNGEVFQPELITARQQRTGWVLTQGQRVIVECGPNATDAQAMLDAIRQHHFDAICHIGQGEGSLVFFVRCR